MVDAAGTTKYSYTAGNQLWTEDGPFASDTVTNTYVNRLRAALSLQQPTGAWTNGFAYDAARRLTNVMSQAGSFANVYATGVGGNSGFSSRLVQRQVLANNSAITNNYDSVARLLATHLRTSAGVLTNKHEYLYNPGSQRTNETRMDASTVAYAYDNIGQLKVADSSVAAEDRGYAYDAAWNLNYGTNNGVLSTFAVDGKNQLTSAPEGQDYYDANGNLVESGAQKGGDGTGNYVYDDENRLIQFIAEAIPDGGSELTPTTRSDFLYDGLGRLRQRTDYSYAQGTGTWGQTGQTRYCYDGMRVVQERNSANTPTVSYTRGNDLSGSIEGAGGIGGLLARSSGYSGGNWTSHAYYHADGNGNITFMLNGSQTMVARYRYDPFGNTISSSGSLAIANTYRFSSKEIHVNSGMYYYGYRFYDPGLQRWINRDPIEEFGGANLYSFCANDGLDRYDIFGLVLPPGGGGTWPIIPPIKEPPPQYPQGFAICQRDLAKDGSCDCAAAIGNALGEHTYIQYVDGDGNKWGYGWGGGRESLGLSGTLIRAAARHARRAQAH